MVGVSVGVYRAKNNREKENEGKEEEEVIAVVMMVDAEDHSEKDRERERVSEGGSRRKGGKRRKQKAIAYERQLAPLMARETKQKSGARRAQTQ